jgi:quinol---cytochrome c reductase cytochrome b subunit, bacillus type
VSADTTPSTGSSSWTARLRSRTLDTMPADQALPDQQPAYVASWIYPFGVATLASLLVVVVTGLVLAMAGPDWWHVSSFGHFVNSLHLWSVEIFFFVMVVHLWGKFWMAAWRGNRALTWMTGVLSFLVSIGAAFTGYLVQTNFDSQWIAAEAKDGINSTGAGAFWNVLDVGQMMLWHVTLLPIAVGLIAVLHIVMVRVRGVVPPIGIDSEGNEVQS